MSHKKKIIKSVSPTQFCLEHDINMSMTEVICLAFRVSRNESPGLKKRLLEEMERVIDYEKRFCSTLKI